MAHKLTISLVGSEPKIARTVIVPEKFTFHELHQVIQTVMNWEDYHLYQFNLGAPYQSDMIRLYDEDNDFGFAPRHQEYEATETLLSEIFTPNRKKINYIYDFGDDWLHQITILSKPKEEVLFPICVKGEGAAPPEDCGGIPGFYHMLETLNNPKKSKDKDDMKDWLGFGRGDTYEKLYGFDLDDTNQMLLENFE